MARVECVWFQFLLVYSIRPACATGYIAVLSQSALARLLRP